MKIQILVICRHHEILETILRLINRNEDWQAVGASADEQAISLFRERVFDLVLLGSGIEEHSEMKLRACFTSQHPGVVIIQHFGGGSGLLGNEIMSALDLHHGK